MAKEVKLGPFKGMNNIDDERNLYSSNPEVDSFVRQATNVDFDRDGDISRRVGYTKRLDLTDSHSLYSNAYLTLLVTNGYLNKLEPDSFALTQLTPIAGNSVSYTDVQGNIYFTDNTQVGRITTMGVYLPGWTPNPSTTPLVTSASGSLVSGKYQVALTNISASGEESGADLGVPFEVSSGGIQILGLSQDSGVSYVRVYMTGPGGDVFYAQGDVPVGNTQVTISAHKKGRVLETQFMEPLPAGHIICHHYGRNYVAVGNTVWYSEPLRQGLTRLDDNYFPSFSERIKILMSHPKGLFIVADKTYWLSGTEPEKMSIVPVYPHSAVEGTGAYVSASVFGFEFAGVVPYWFSDKGAVLGVEGTVQTLTEKQLEPGTYEKGATIYREVDGVRSLVTSVTDKGDTSKFQASDSAVFEVRRNGIIIP